MRIEFDDSGYDYVEVKPSSGGISIVISSRDLKNPRSAVVNSAEVTKEEFLKLISEAVENSDVEE